MSHVLLICKTWSQSSQTRNLYHTNKTKQNSGGGGRESPHKRNEGQTKTVLDLKERLPKHQTPHDMKFKEVNRRHQPGTTVLSLQ